jgi:carboxylesterase type B
MWRFVPILIALSAMTSLVLAQDENTCLVYSLSGPIRGQLVTSELGKQVCAFFGIPYAKPPVGDLRFKRPLPVDNWQDVLNATVLPDMCSQNKSLTRGGPNKAVGISEDCLYLNLWVPLSIFNSSSRSAAVMLWIHGGGFFAGSISEPLINNPILAGENDVIVAFMQYRLGPLGSLYFGVEDAPGNMGLIDQNLALKWIYNNIVEFGGNNGEITLFGESAGSFSVAYHLCLRFPEIILQEEYSSLEHQLPQFSGAQRKLHSHLLMNLPNMLVAFLQRKTHQRKFLRFWPVS